MNSRPAPTAGTASTDWAKVREQRAARGEHNHWRSLVEFEDSSPMRELLEREFPPSALAPTDDLNRRSFLKLMSASLALAGLNACTRQPIEQIVPYVRQPEEMVPGEPLYFASAMGLGGFGTGIIVKSREGRPIKADGNPQHPASLGGSDVWIQACLLDLYDPERARAVTRFGNPTSFSIFLSELHQALADQAKKQGAGLRILTGTVTSPTLSGQLQAVLQKFPEAHWHQWEPINRDNVLEGARLAFGEYLSTHYHFDKAAVIASFDSDFLYTHPQRLRYTRHFTDGRRIVQRESVGEVNRLYVLESTPSITGSMADHRLPLSSPQIENAARTLANQLGLPVNLPAAQLSEPHAKWVSALMRDLRAHRGAGVVTFGQSLPAPLHALEHMINNALGNRGHTVTHTTPAEAQPVNHLDSLRDLADEMKRGRVELLLMLGGNPVFDAPADFEFAQQLKRVQRAIHLSGASNETSAFCEWHIPQAHFLEAWSDARSFDGTVTIMQPLIAPLFNGKSAHELLNLVLQTEPMCGDYETVREFWKSQGQWNDFESGWRVALHNGLIDGTAFPEKNPELRDDLASKLNELSRSSKTTPRLEITFRPDPHLWDGEFAHNPWLQEAPRPLTKLSWDNAVIVSPALAQEYGLTEGDVVELRTSQRSIKGPAFVLPGQAERTIAVHLGAGRKRPAQESNGFNCYPLRTSGALWYAAAGISLHRTGESYRLVTTQTHQRTHSDERQVFRNGTVRQFAANPNFVKERSESPLPQQTLYDPKEHEYPLKWGMAIDLTTCIGCNACILGCNVENNIPVVGKDQVARNREMLWLRVDTYFSGPLDAPEFDHQPVPCMHCENAPCEYVCPVAATLHDHEGLNLQVYNRCIGTRYCSNNCPYKVRRFNFHRYSDFHSKLDALRHNPEVTVRWRGVMEKCTYCVQRISAARIAAKEENRPLRDGEVKTACQEACPANAIIFGPISDPQSEVSRYKRHPLDFSMLGQLNTRPRTTYTAKLRNPNPELDQA